MSARNLTRFLVASYPPTTGVEIVAAAGMHTFWARHGASIVGPVVKGVGGAELADMGGPGGWSHNRSGFGGQSVNASNVTEPQT
jgi:hypothetical protein